MAIENFKGVSMLEFLEKGGLGAIVKHIDTQETQIADLAEKVEALGNDDRLPAVEHDVADLAEKVEALEEDTAKALKYAKFAHKRVNTSRKYMESTREKVENIIMVMAPEIRPKGVIPDLGTDCDASAMEHECEDETGSGPVWNNGVCSRCGVCMDVNDGLKAQEKRLQETGSFICQGCGKIDESPLECDRLSLTCEIYRCKKCKGYTVKWISSSAPELKPCPFCEAK